MTEPSSSIPCSSITGVFLPESFTASGIHTKRCPACGGWPHEGGVASCPQVGAVVYDADGNLREIHKR